MGFIGGDLRQDFISRIKGADPGRLLAVSIDAGKHTAAAMVCDFWGEIVAPPFEFALNERGFQDLAAVLARAEAERDASWIRAGLEQAGHYHRPLQVRLEAHGLDIALFNPAQVKVNRNQDLLRSLESDARDLAAIAELLIRGKGREAAGVDERTVSQAAVASHRRRKGKKCSATHISREGKVALREAIIEPGRALSKGHPDFARYAMSLRSRGKPGGAIQCALGQRANRVAFAMMRDQRPFDPTRW